MMMLKRLVDLLLILTTAHAWLSSGSFQARSRTSQRSVLTMSATPDLKGKVVYQRLLHRLSPRNDAADHNDFSVEERVRFKTDPEDEAYLAPAGRRTLILRGSPESETHLGPELCRLDVHEASLPTGAGTDSAIECSICLALYLASNPDILVGNAIELQTDLGLGGLLGSIAAGFAQSNGERKETIGIEDEGLPQKHDSPLPEALKKVTLSGSDDALMNLAFSNVKNSNIPAEKIDMREFDWRRQRPEQLSKQRYHVILGSDIAFSYPNCRDLARTVAYSLEPLLWENTKAARFVHVCPDNRDDISYLKNFLQKGYLMGLDHGYVKLQKLFLKPAILDEAEGESAVEKLPIEVQNMKESTYQSLEAMHSPDFTGDNGEYIFPIENGAFENGSEGTYLEQEPKNPW